MTGLDRGEAVQSYKGKTPYTPSITQYFQVCASRKNLYKKRMTLKPKGNPLFQENEAHFRYKSKATTMTLGGHPRSPWRKGEEKDRLVNPKADVGKGNFQKEEVCMAVTV